ncbi:EamA family transporter [Trinickia dabaoshanensis]|uniref:EamA family transporter n=1 Tax=Trinickia dabaoshanensis TaxID=564714 RepID=A0A2N7VG40_9BURK|nr:EamA family transporter [Trinickia dabaoshanensis]PMS16120.1 EamA family transporter [Trinickia dabaoshanensis]
MKTNAADVLSTAVAPVVWGSTYIVTTQFLPNFSPMTVAMLRALPAGLLLLAIVRQVPRGADWLRVFILGALNISVFLSMLFVAAYRLPGGVAGTVAAVQPLFAVFLARLILSSPLRRVSIVAVLIGIAGVALLVLTPRAALDPIGVAAGLAGAASMAVGNVLARKWQPPVSLLAFTAWQLTAGGILLIPVVLLFAPPMPAPTLMNAGALAWLALVGAALTYVLWFRGVARLESAVLSPLLFISPLTAAVLGWVFLNQTLTRIQIAGIVFVVGSIWLSQRPARAAGAPISTTNLRSNR